MERFLKKQKEQKEKIVQSYLLQDILHITDTKHPTYYMIANLVKADFPLYTIEEILEIIHELKECKIVEYYSAGRVLEKIEEYTLTENEIELAFEKFEKNKPLTDIHMWKVFERKSGTKCSIQDYLKLFAFTDNRSFICEKREKFVKWLRDNMPIEAKQLLIMKRDVEAREYVKEIIDEITAPDE